MNMRMALAFSACAGALLVAAPVSSLPLGAAGEAVKTTQMKSNLVEEVRHRRHHRRFAHRGHRRYYGHYRHRRHYGYYRHRRHFYPYYYSYYRPYYYPYYYRRRPHFSIYLHF